MKVRRWVPHQDYKYVQEWAAARGLPCPTFKELSIKGSIVDGVAIGFLYTDTSSSTAFMENFISNKFAKVTDVHRAISLIIKDLSYEAQVLDITMIRAVTCKRGILKVAIRNGFKVAEVGNVLMYRGFE